MVSELGHQRIAYGWSPDQNSTGPSKNALQISSDRATPEIVYEDEHQAIVASSSDLPMVISDSDKQHLNRCKIHIYTIYYCDFSIYQYIQKKLNS